MQPHTDEILEKLSGLLSESEARFRNMADCSPVLLWMSRTDGLCDFFNQTWLDFTGRTLDQEWGVGWAAGVHVLDFQRCMDTYLQAFNERRPFELIYRLKRRDGAYRWILDRGTPRYTGTKVFAGFIGSCIDITERVEAEEKIRNANAELEDKVRRRTAELTRLNGELEIFSHGISHEIKTPLRHISYLAETLSEKLKADTRADSECLKDCQRITEVAAQAVTLANDLLKFAQIGLKELSTVDVDMNALVTDVIGSGGFAIDGREVRWRIDSLPCTRGNAGMLKQVWINLIENALKYAKPQVASVIDIGSESDPSGTTYYVRDNGCGFDMKHAEDIFKVFYRLGKMPEKSGTGIGLALVKSVVQRHGGRVWAESRPGEGSAFYFYLPKRGQRET